MKKPIAQLIAIKLNSIARLNNEFVGPIDVLKEEDIKVEIRKLFDTTLKGIRGNVLVKWNGQMFLCEPNQVSPDRDYSRIIVRYHPLAEKFSI
jgi:hypothetical protein